MKKEEIDNVLICEIKPGDTCVFTVSLSFSKGHVFDRGELDRFLTSKIKEFFESEE